jgi:hypothetical protein
VDGFAEYAVGGYRPDGGSPSYPLMTQEQLELMKVPYHRWAPAPYNILRYSCLERLIPLYMDQDTGATGLKNPPYAELFTRLRSLKAKSWKGIVPISHDRWLERKMDDPENYRNLLELMQDIIDIFLWFNHDHVLDRMRGGFN